MKTLIKRILEDMGMWATWVVIPIIVEIVPSLIQFFKLLRKKRRPQGADLPDKLPNISMIVPVYNSSATLYACIQSIADSTYPNHLIQITVVDNGSTDDSFMVFQKVQQDFTNLRLQWMNAQQGKSKALNSAIYNSTGTYIIHIDSDGVLETNALMNMVIAFENDLTIDAMTGVVMTQRQKIDAVKKWGLKLLCENEYCEYAQSFLAGRNIESQSNQLFTISGAFSGFRKSSLVRTHLYNPDTVGEDTDITFQIRESLNGKVILCAEALFFVEPIEGLGKLYTQRQRWQRAEIEVAHIFKKSKIKISRFFSDFMVRRLILDHTFVFPRLIWYFAIFVLTLYNYSLTVIFGSIIVMYVLYVLNSLLNYCNVKMYLKSFTEERNYYKSKWYVMLTLPLYNFICFWIRVVGLVNTMTSPTTWKSQTFTEEIEKIAATVKNDFSFKKENK